MLYTFLMHNCFRRHLFFLLFIFYYEREGVLIRAYNYNPYTHIIVFTLNTYTPSKYMARNEEVL